MLCETVRFQYQHISATIAQVVERIIGNDEVTGPTPVASF